MTREMDRRRLSNWLQHIILHAAFKLCVVSRRFISRKKDNRSDGVELANLRAQLLTSAPTYEGARLFIFLSISFGRFFPMYCEVTLSSTLV